MGKLHRLAVVGLLTVSIGSLGGLAGSAQSGLVLADLDKRLQDAVVVGDTQLLEQHLSADFVFTHFGGGQDTRSHWIDVARHVPREFLARTVSEQVVEEHGDVALVFGRLDVRAAAQGGQQECYALRYVHVYARRGGRWMFLSHRTTHMIEPSHPCR